jgi:hypothetical protein
MESADNRGHQEPDEPEARLSPGSLLRRHWFWTVLVASVVAVWLAPVIVAHSPLLNGIIARATGKLNGKATAKSASLGWFSPITVYGVVILDKRGQTVAEIEHVSAERSLSGIAWNHRSLGRVRIERPSLTLILRDDGSNLEDLLTQCATDIMPLVTGAKQPIDAQIEVVDGRIAVHHVRTGRTWQIDNVQATCLVAADPSKPVSLKLSGVVANRRRPGQFALSGTIYHASNPGNEDSEITLRTNGLPLAIFGPLLSRFSPETRLGGRLTTSLVCHAGAALDRFSLQGTLTAEELRLAASSLGADPLKIERLSADGKLVWQDGRLVVEQLTAKSDLGELSVSGTFAGKSKPGDSWPAALSRQVCQLRGRLDLARLAATLPGTLRIRKGTEITSGQVSLTLAVQPDAQGSAWSGQVEASNLAAVNQGRKIVWDQPIQVSLAAHATAQGAVVESLKCESNFLRLVASGTTERLAASASFDLAQLASQLAGFVDLGQTQPAGGGWAQFGWQRSPQQTFQAAARLHLENFHLALPQRPAWSEENLTATLVASGQTDFAAARIDAASLDLVAGRDQTSVRLLRPVADLRSGVWPVEGHSEGDLARWIPRLAPWFSIADWRLGGTYTLGFKASASAGAVRWDDVQIVADQLQVQGPGLHLAEPRCQATLAGGWDRAQRRIEVKSARVILGGLALSADGLVVALPAGGRIELSGVVDCQGDLDRLQQWTVDPAAAPAWRIAGQLSSRTEFRQSPGAITAATTTTVRRLSVARSSGEQFQEPEVRLTAQASYNIADGTLLVQQAQLSSDCLAAGVSGRLVTGAAPGNTGVAAGANRDVTVSAGVGPGGDMAGAVWGRPPPRPPPPPPPPPPGLNQGRLDADGKLDYDLDKLSALARSFWGPKVQVSGRGSNPFGYHGPLDPSAAGANASLAWQSAQVFGFQVGPGQLRLALDRGSLTAGVQDLTVNEGRVRLAPEIRLASSLPSPATGTSSADRPAAVADGLILYHAPGRIAEQIRLNPELCAQALKFIAPAMANAGTADGRFSVDIDSCRIPLANPAQGEVLGRLTIHTAEVAPGPLVAELAVLLGRASPARISQESVINFRMADGRVYHDGMELVFPDLTIRTRGWVAFDDTLSLTAEMSVPPKWLAGNPAAATLRSQTIRLPVGGTLKRPVIDRKVLAQTSAQFLRNAAHNLIQEEFHRQVDRLLAPPQPVR